MEQISYGIGGSNTAVDSGRVTVRAKSSSRAQGSIKLIRGLIWVYFFLLIFEGFLRMIFPSLSTLLFVVRDPFLLVTYLVAQASRIFPWNRFVFMFWLLGLIAFVFGIAQNPNAPLVALFGFRASFLHVPVIFLIASIMDERDVRAFGHWFLILSLPMALLMVAQFQVGSDHWLNRGLEMQFKQIDSAAGKIRPPGTFSFVMGPILFFAHVVAFVFYAQFDQKRFSRVLVVAAAVGTCLALAVSGSRSALAGVAVVVLTAIVAVAITKPKAITKLTKFFFVIGIAVLIASQFSVFDEGKAVMTERIENASNTEGGFEGFILRSFGEFISGYQAITVSELTGAGLGVGTNAGSALLSGKVTYLLAEGEWARMILEIGPFMGIIFILMRVGLAVWLFGRSLGAASTGKMLPVLLFGASGLTIVVGQWGQPTALGFAVLGGGLTLAALRAAPEPEESAGTT